MVRPGEYGGLRMGRGKRGLFEELGRAPWPLGLVVGVMGYLLIGHGLPAWFARQGGPLFRAYAVQSGLFTLLAWLVLLMCAMAAFASFVDARRRRHLLDTCTGLDSIAAVGWRNFERLVGEAFRLRGYTVEETGLGGADGGIDLILRRDGRRILVQCKHWRRDRVPVNVVREMYGLLAHHSADAVRIAALGGFTPDAARFAAGKPIELIDGPALLAMIREIQQGSTEARGNVTHIDPASAGQGTGDAGAPTCPRCKAPMVKRTNRRDGNQFWGCSGFPRCRSTQ